MTRWLTMLLAAALVVVAGCSGSEPEIEAQAPVSDVSEPESEPEPAPEPEPEPEPTFQPEDTRPRSVLTGEPIDEDVLVDRPLMIVKIENSPEARPQSGLDAADVVIEEVVEAGVTRFMALFHSEIPDDVGPTRSARPVDADLLPSFGRSGFVYSGARPEVLALLSSTPVLQIAEGGPGFHRLSERRAPHNLYNRLPEALAAVEERDPDVLESPGWVFDVQAPDGEVVCPADTDPSACDDPGTGISIPMSRYYTTGWEYDGATGLYRRLQDGHPSLVTGPGSIGAANVVFLAAQHYLGEPNCYGSPCPETDATTDGARAIVLRDGRRYEATWSKADPAADIALFTESGEPFPLKPGPTWMHLPAPEDLPAPLE